MVKIYPLKSQVRELLLECVRVCVCVQDRCNSASVVNFHPSKVHLKINLDMSYDKL